MNIVQQPPKEEIHALPQSVQPDNAIRVRSTRSAVYLDSPWSKALIHTITKQLQTPYNLRVIDNVLHWDTVQNAIRYTVYLNGTPVNSDTNQLSLAQLEPAIYTIRVQAMGNEFYTTSEMSEEITHTSTMQLSAPINLRIEFDTLHWDAVANASYYEVDINGNTQATSTNSLSVGNLQAGEYNIHVRALGDGHIFLTQ